MSRAPVWLALGLCVVACATPEVPDPEEADPIEPVNRAIFFVNDRLDVFVLEPAATGWTWITPETVRTHLWQFFDNLRFPVRFVGSLLQAKLRGSGHELARFGVNTTLGLAGFFDPASGMGLQRQDEDVGQAFGRWGFAPGPYLVLPLFGPSSPRDALGLAADTALSSGPSLAAPVAAAVASGLNLLNSRALVLEDVREVRAGSLDFYASVRSAWMERRRALVADRGPESESAEDLYNFEDDAP